MNDKFFVDEHILKSDKYSFLFSIPCLMVHISKDSLPLEENFISRAIKSLDDLGLSKSEISERLCLKQSLVEAFFASDYEKISEGIKKKTEDVCLFISLLSGELLGERVTREKYGLCTRREVTVENDLIVVRRNLSQTERFIIHRFQRNDSIFSRLDSNKIIRILDSARNSNPNAFVNYNIIDQETVDLVSGIKITGDEIAVKHFLDDKGSPASAEREFRAFLPKNKAIKDTVDDIQRRINFEQNKETKAEIQQNLLRYDKRDDSDGVLSTFKSVIAARTKLEQDKCNENAVELVKSSYGCLENVLLSCISIMLNNEEYLKDAYTESFYRGIDKLNENSIKENTFFNSYLFAYEEDDKTRNELINMILGSKEMLDMIKCAKSKRFEKTTKDVMTELFLFCFFSERSRSNFKDIAYNFSSKYPLFISYLKYIKSLRNDRHELGFSETKTADSRKTMFFADAVYWLADNFLKSQTTGEAFGEYVEMDYEDDELDTRDTSSFGLFKDAVENIKRLYNERADSSSMFDYCFNALDHFFDCLGYDLLKNEVSVIEADDLKSSRSEFYTMLTYASSCTPDYRMLDIELPNNLNATFTASNLNTNKKKTLKWACIMYCLYKYRKDTLFRQIMFHIPELPELMKKVKTMRGHNEIPTPETYKNEKQTFIRVIDFCFKANKILEGKIE